mgnify:CR=1 FL=1|jgi:hypothetical protein|tara:strand:- start:835 stop:1056 length:222 start_codon:yes stop_codon:yes gene_type:complete
MIANNHLHSGHSEPERGTGTTAAWDHQSLYEKASAGEFNPKGALGANLAPPVLKFDMNGIARAHMDAKGAVAL